MAMHAELSTSATKGFDASAITRPDPKLLTYYFLVALLSGPFFPIAFLPLFFKYHTLQYRFDEDGISMRWGILFRREVHLTHRRIQDIHLSRNLVQRWLGLATVDVQTASGSATPEMRIEGVLEAEALRDYLYGRMRGGAAVDSPEEETASAPRGDEALALLREIRDLLRQAPPRRSDA